MPLPQRLSFVTIGAWSVSGMRDFYRRCGWSENDGGTDDYVSFRVGSVVLAPGRGSCARRATRERDRWNGVTFAINFTSRADVDRAIADVEGNRWELAWAPGFDPA